MWHSNDDCRVSAQTAASATSADLSLKQPTIQRDELSIWLPENIETFQRLASQHVQQLQTCIHRRRGALLLGATCAGVAGNVVHNCMDQCLRRRALVAPGAHGRCRFLRMQKHTGIEHAHATRKYQRTVCKLPWRMAPTDLSLTNLLHAIAGGAPISN